MSGLIPALFGRVSYADKGLMRGAHPDSPLATCAWIAAIFVFTLICFALYHYPSGLYDMAHYITAGISQVRDHKDLQYVYTPAAQGGPSYEYFQDGTVNFDSRLSYPSKLYAGLFGLIYEINGKLRFAYVQWYSFLACFASNVLIYLIGSRFFKGATLLAFLLSVALLPLARSGLSAGNDAFGYFSCLLLLWLSLCLRINPFVVGLVGGVLFHFRSQSLAILFVLPLLSAHVFDRRFFREALLPLLAGAALTFTGVGLLFDAAVESKAASTPVSFYINFFRESFYGPSEIHLAAKKFVDNFIALFDRDHLFILAYTSVLCLFVRAAPFARMLSVGAWIYIAVPLVVYTLDRHSEPHARYYMVAIPLLTLAWFIVVEQLGRNAFIRARGTLLATTAIICAAWYNAYGFPSIGMDTPKVIAARLKFLDFPRAQRTFAENFDRDDILIVNHSLITGLSNSQYPLYVPDFSSFKSGDNREISGMAFVYSDRPPNDFFRPSSWLVNGNLPDEIVDDNGVTFRKIYGEVSQFPAFAGGVENDAVLVIYKNTETPPRPVYDASGRRVRSEAVASRLAHERLAGTDFSIGEPWGARFELARDAAGGGVVVGPGPNGENILYQRFAATPGERFRLVARVASVGTPAAQARLQVNWLNSEDGFIGSDVKIIAVTAESAQFSAMVVAPPAAVSGLVYVSPHGASDTVRYLEMSVKGR